VERKKIILIILIIAVLAGCVIGGYYAYGHYMNQKFEENFKLQYQAAINAQKHDNASEKYLKGNSFSKPDYEDAVNNYLTDQNKSVNYLKQRIKYLEEMEKYSPDEIHKKYTEALMNNNLENLKFSQLNIELLKLLVWPGVFSNETRAKEIQSQMNDTLQKMEISENEISKAKLQSSELNNQIQNLTEQAEMAIY
jgi:uncharacterized protein YneF (UPF0154 family)